MQRGHRSRAATQIARYQRPSKTLATQGSGLTSTRGAKALRSDSPMATRITLRRPNLKCTHAQSLTFAMSTLMQGRLTPDTLEGSSKGKTLDPHNNDDEVKARAHRSCCILSFAAPPPAASTFFWCGNREKWGGRHARCGTRRHEGET